MKGMGILLLVMVLTLAAAGLWDKVPIISQGVHAALDPTIGKLLDWNVTIGLIIITAILNLATTLLHKYATDQNVLKQIKEEQKLVNEQMKLYRKDPTKSMELSAKSLELAGKSLPITMRPVAYTAIPFILLIRWIGDYFKGKEVEILGFMSGFWAYFAFFVIFSIIFRRLLKVH